MSNYGAEQQQTEPQGVPSLCHNPEPRDRIIDHREDGGGGYYTHHSLLLVSLNPQTQQSPSSTGRTDIKTTTQLKLRQQQNHRKDDIMQILKTTFVCFYD